MNKLSLNFCFCLILVFVSSCAPDYTDEIEDIYQQVKKLNINTWSSKTSSTMDWDTAVDYCENLTEGGYSDWRLPTITELRTLIKNCPQTDFSGSCTVTNDCLSYSECRNDACAGCDYDETGNYSKLGDNNWLWSASTRPDDSNYAWFVYFKTANVHYNDKSNSCYVRCVR